MKLKKYLNLGIGMLIGFGISVAGISYASQNGFNHTNLITSEKAKTIMLDKVPGATILEFSYDGDDKIPKYDGTLIKDEYEYEIDVNAKTGSILKIEKEKNFINNNTTENNNNSYINNKPSDTESNSSQNNSSYIGESKARSIMLSKVPGATINKFYLDKDRTPEYEGELIKGDIEYDISVDAITGVINEFSQENRYDDDDRYDD